MASLATACRLSARVASRRALGEASITRGYQTSAPCLAASNFTMPALSPTMTQGKIASWKVKEGDTYSAGDVLLEIETDKASMDVEAQDDGIMMKITEQDGATDVPVGQRIAVTAEPGDDITTLEIPATAKPPPPPEPKPTPPPSSAEPKGEALTKASVIPKKPAAPQTYPLFPAVQQLMKQKGVDMSKVSKMTPTGPKGRLLKGDVLAYLGIVESHKPETIQARFDKLSHLDLSGIKVAALKAAPPKKAEAKPAAATPPPQAVEKKLQLSLPVVLGPALEAQRRMKKCLGTAPPLSAFISRATELANDRLPLSGGRKPTADEEFDAILGLDSIPKTSKGFYIPQVTAIPSTPPRAAAPPTTSSIYDDLLSAGPVRPQQAATTVDSGSGSAFNMLTLSVPKSETKRAQVFLERVKVSLEAEPVKLVLNVKE